MCGPPAHSVCAVAGSALTVFASYAQLCFSCMAEMRFNSLARIHSLCSRCYQKFAFTCNNPFDLT